MSFTRKLIQNVDSWKDSDHKGGSRNLCFVARAPRGFDAGGPRTSILRDTGLDHILREGGRDSDLFAAIVVPKEMLVHVSNK